MTNKDFKQPLKRSSLTYCVSLRNFTHGFGKWARWTHFSLLRYHLVDIKVHRIFPGNISYSTFSPGWSKLCDIHWGGKKFKLFSERRCFTGEIFTEKFSRVNSAGALRQSVCIILLNINVDIQNHKGTITFRILLYG